MLPTEMLQPNATNVDHYNDLIRKAYVYSMSAYDINTVAYIIHLNRALDNQGNGHHAPVDKKTNWGRRDANLPGSYLGWYGRIWIVLDGYEEKSQDIGMLWSRMHPNTGTGGGGLYNLSPVYQNHIQSFFSPHPDPNFTKTRLVPTYDCFSWDYRVWLDNMPLVRQELQAYELLMPGEDCPLRRADNYHWINPDYLNEEIKNEPSTS